MNEFERRALDIAQVSPYIASILKDGKKPVWMDSFAYNTSLASTTSPLAGGASIQSLIQIQADSEFVLTYMSATLFGTTNCLVQVTDTGSGKTFFNEPTIVANAFGVNGFPFLLPLPRVIEKSVNLKVDLTNNTAATNMTGAYFAFYGVRLYYAG